VRSYESAGPEGPTPEAVAILLGILAVIGVAAVAAVVEHWNRLRVARDTEKALEGAAAADAARQQLKAAAAEADRVIDAYRRDAYRKGYES
jgi:hypothetical protein